MPKSYIITEDDTMRQVILRILAESLLSTTDVLDGTNRYGVISGARTLLVTRLLPVALVINAHSSDDIKVRGQVADIRYLVEQASRGIPYRILLAIPEIESVFFQDKGLLERLTNQQFTEREWRSAHYGPKAFLCDVLGTPSNPALTLLPMLTDADVIVLRQHPLIMELSTFLASVASNEKELPVDQERCVCENSRARTAYTHSI